MTYSLHTLNNTREKPPEMTGWQRFIQEIALAVGFVVLLFWLLAIVSHSALDPAWTTSGSNPHIRNWGGRVGAAVSDLSFSCWVIRCFGAIWLAWSVGSLLWPIAYAAKKMYWPTPTFGD